MKKTKVLLPILLISGLLGLSACSLFNDDDIAVHNSFKSIDISSEYPEGTVFAGGVAGTTNSKVPNALCFKNISYETSGEIVNTYGESGKNHTIYNVNGGQNYKANESTNNYDLYVPNNAVKDAENTVIFFIHGGAWVSGFKTDVNPYVHKFANRGYVTATIKYTLLKRTMDDPSLSIFRNLDEIDACIKSIKSVLGELGFNTSLSKLVIGGASSGAHLSMLYAYSRGNDSALPIKFVVDAVGPVDIKPNAWKSFKNASDEVLDAGLDKDAIKAQEDAENIDKLHIAGEKDKDGNPVYWNDYQTMRIANGMCGLPFTTAQVEAASSDKVNIDNANGVYDSMTKANGGEDLLSVTHWITSNTQPKIICAYAGQDSIVGINQYATLQTKLDFIGITYESFYFKNSDHTQISKEANPTEYDKFVNEIDNWCKA